MNQKEKIIEETTRLIIESQGDLSLVTARKIAQDAGVGLGLINYHFGNKDQLITECVQRIIHKEIRAFVPKDIKYSDDPVKADQERLTTWAKQVFEFFYENKSIARVSILSDLLNDTSCSNAIDMQRGLLLALTSEIDEKEKQFMVFSLASIMQAAFLQEKTVLSRLGYDLSLQKDRELFIDSAVEEIFRW